jgi:hypothetical protein
MSTEISFNIIDNKVFLALWHKDSKTVATGLPLTKDELHKLIMDAATCYTVIDQPGDQTP